MNREETLNHVRSKQNIVKVKGFGKNRVTYGGDRREEPLPTMIEKGLNEVEGRRVEILSTDRLVWCVVLESATQS
jgi:hypothetical protein